MEQCCSAWSQLQLQTFPLNALHVWQLGDAMTDREK